MQDCDIAKLSRCFWCGKEKEEIIIATEQTIEWCNNKSMSVIVDYEPCSKCKEDFAKGVQIIEVQEFPIVKTQPFIRKGFYPTGNTWVVKREEAHRMFETESDTVLLGKETAENIGLYSSKVE